jgi:lysyl-tRNA synthetase class I
MYHIITEYFNEVMNSESDIFVSSHKNLVNKSIEISKRNACKVYSPKTDEELEIILAFQDVLMEVDEMLNPKFIYDLVEKAEKYAEKLKAEKLNPKFIYDLVEKAEKLKAEKLKAEELEEEAEEAEKEAEELEEEAEEEDLKDEDYVDEEEDETEDLEAEEEIYELLMESKNGYQNKHIRFVYGNE